MQRNDSYPRFIAMLGELAEGLVRIPLAKLGKFVKGNQKFAITRQTMAEMVKNFRAEENDTVIDYEHSSMNPEIAMGGPVPAAGWLKEVEDEPDADGILWGRAEFTEKARGMIAAKEYRYLSPEINYGARDKSTGTPQGATLEAVALLNRPFLEALPAIALGERGWDEEIDRGDAADRKQASVKVTKIALSEGAGVVTFEDGETQTVTAIENASPKVVRLSEVKRASDGSIDLESLAQGEAAVAPEVFRAVLAEREVAAAVTAGKIAPAQRASWMKIALGDIVNFRELVAGMKTVDLTERGIGSDGKGTDTDQAAAEVDKLVKAKMAADEGMTYGTALKVVLSERPDLASTKKREMAARKGA